MYIRLSKDRTGHGSEKMSQNKIEFLKKNMIYLDKLFNVKCNWIVFNLFYREKINQIDHLASIFGLDARFPPLNFAQHIMTL